MVLRRLCPGTGTATPRGYKEPRCGTRSRHLLVEEEEEERRRTRGCWGPLCGE